LQVFDVAYHRPDKVLQRIYANLAEEEARGNSKAADTRRRLRILTCGGDGTVAWVMKVVKQLDLQPQPPIAIMPLGTGEATGAGQATQLEAGADGVGRCCL
jgi:diacylglycerol kinase (ATP)